MKNIYLKYILLSVALTSSLLFTACEKKSEPVNEVQETTQIEESEQATTSDENDPTVTNADRGAMEQLEVNLEDTTTTETNTNVDSTGVDVQLSEDEYQGTRPEDEEVSEEAVEDVAANTGVAMTENEALADIQNMLDQGLISETEYQELLELIEDVYSPKPTQSAQSPTYSQQQLTPEQQAAADAMITTGQGDQRTNIQYGQSELPPDLHGKFIGN